jgi:inner membrane protein
MRFWRSSMSPATHLFASWLIAAKTTHNQRDCRLVSLAGILPDADGLGLVLDWGARAFGDHQTTFYGQYHHVLLHGAFGGIVITALLTAFARERLRVAALCMLVFHLHLLCDLVGSRGPSPEDLWPIFYFGPFTKDPMWLWRGQWRLDAWPNQVLSWVLLGCCLAVAVRRGDSFVGVFNRWADSIFLRVLRHWHAELKRRLSREH